MKTMKMTKLLNLFLLINFIIINNVYANAKMDFLTGFYSITGKTTEESKQISGLGAYQFSLLYPFLSNYEAVFSYNMIFSNTISGDVSFGPSFGINYFPLNFSENGLYSKNKVQIEISDKFKPYIGLRFNQRQFASVKNSYAGFGGVLGTEYKATEKINLKFEFKSNSYSGISNTSLTETNLMLGIIFSFP